MITDYCKTYYTNDEWARQRLWINSYVTDHGYGCGMFVTRIGFDGMPPVAGDHQTFDYAAHDFITKRYRRFWLIANSSSFRGYWTLRLSHKGMILHGRI